MFATNNHPDESGGFLADLSFLGLAFLAMSGFIGLIVVVAA